MCKYDGESEAARGSRRRRRRRRRRIVLSCTKVSNGVRNL
jgi:hypothetical protein